MKHFYCLILIAFLFTTASAQQKIFSVVYYDTTNYSGGYGSAAVVQSYDGSYIITSTIEPGLVFKIDTAGHYVWSKTIGDQNTYFNTIIKTHDSCFVLAGADNNLFSDSSEEDIMIVKINNDGDTLWSKVLGGNNDDYVSSIRETYDHGYIVAGYSYNIENRTGNVYVISLDSIGNITWTSVLSENNNVPGGASIKQTSDRGFVLVGNDYTNAFIIKLTSAGSVAWSKKYSAASQEISAWDLALFNDSLMCYLFVNGYAVLMKTDASGNTLWAKEYFSGFHNFNEFVNYTMSKTSDGGYVFYVGGQCPGSIIKVDSSGSRIWSNGSQFISNSIIQTNDGGYMAVGGYPACFAAREASFSRSDPQVGIVKMDSSGFAYSCVENFRNPTDSVFAIVDSSVSFSSSTYGTVKSIYPVIKVQGAVVDSGCFNIGGGIKENYFNPFISLYPNPATNTLVMNGNWNLGNKAMSVFNVYGQLIYSAEFNGAEKIISCESYSPGIYFIQVLNNGKRWSGTFVKE